MFGKKSVELMVGLFMLAGFASLFVMAMKVSGLTGYIGNAGYSVVASFDNIGGLKVRSPVTIAGVRVGEVRKIDLDPETFKANVVLMIQATEDNIPIDSAASILTEGLLGSNYVGLTAGFEEEVLVEGGVIEETHPALVLENLVGQLLFNISKDDKKEEKEEKK